MTSRFLGLALATGCLLVVTCLLASTLLLSTPTASERAGQDVFDPTRVWTLHLHLSDKEFTALQPRSRFGYFSEPGKAGPGHEKRELESNLFGVEFPWIQGDLTAGDETYERIGLRYDGNVTYFASSTDIKRPFHLRLKHHDRQFLHGLAGIDLHPGSMDPSRCREVIAYAVFRAAGVPAPRTAYADVTLTVPGKYDREYLGLYTVVEQVDSIFLRDRFETDGGLLMKPHRLRGIDDLGDDWEKYRASYQPQSEATKKQARRVIGFAKLVNSAGDEQFAREIASYLDVDAFLRFLAVNALVANVESFFALGHNYYLFLHPGTSKFHFIPGDLELALANFTLMGSAEQLMNLSLDQPYPGPNRLADRLLALEGMRQRYHCILRDITTTCFTRQRLLRDIETIEKVTKDHLARESKAVAARRTGAGPGLGPLPGTRAEPPDPRTFVDKRLASVESQLDGKSRGYVPRFDFGPGPIGRRPAPSPPSTTGTYVNWSRLPRSPRFPSSPLLTRSTIPWRCRPRRRARCSWPSMSRAGWAERPGATRCTRRR